MLGFSLVIVALVGLLFGMETTSPGVILAVTQASVMTWRDAHAHVGDQICTHLIALGDPGPCGG